VSSPASTTPSTTLGTAMTDECEDGPGSNDQVKNCEFN